MVASWFVVASKFVTGRWREVRLIPESPRAEPNIKQRERVQRCNARGLQPLLGQSDLHVPVCTHPCATVRFPIDAKEFSHGR